MFRARRFVSLTTLVLALLVTPALASAQSLHARLTNILDSVDISGSVIVTKNGATVLR